MASGSVWNLWVWLAGGGCGQNLWVWLVAVFVTRYSRCKKKVPPFYPYNRCPFKKNGRRTGIERNGPFRTYSRFVLIFPFPFSGTGEYMHTRVVSFTCFATQGPARANK